ncbi:MAG: 2-C-methyl-D-erythritol 2,4-cyclodiphosphate synthase [Gammaproteobacteria bacterium]|nr:2-C-methyl-D-erythritol 2,4-cyclodiphosphate synthase [Gammaproteobacteria bacterium]
MRIGHGFDAHRFEEGRPLILGGVTIPYEQGLAAHSDGDVLVHALCDALIGAAALGDIGKHFPDSDVEFKNIDSRILLRDVIDKLEARSFSVSNVDVTVIAQRPKLSGYIEEMKINIADDLGIDSQRINIKATTTEGMGFEGRGEGISAHAVVLLIE